MQVGLWLAVWIAVEMVTGLLFYVARAQLPIGISGALLTAVHIYVGVASVPFLLAKIWLTLPLLWMRSARDTALSPSRERALSALLVMLYTVCYASGFAIYFSTGVVGKAWLVDVHLWSSVLAFPPTVWHMLRHLRPAWRSFTWRLGLLRQGTAMVESAGMTRRAMLGLLVGAWAALATRQVGGLFAPLADEDPNDFPVTLVSSGMKGIDPSTWTVRVHGAVERPLTLTMADLRRMPYAAYTYPLDCISGWSVTREWGGVPLRHVLQLAGAQPDFVTLAVRSGTGYEQSLSRGGALRPETLLCSYVNGVPLTEEHGFPVRLMAPDVIGEVCVKWVSEIEVQALS
jgi:hypothetical protein